MNTISDEPRAVLRLRLIGGPDGAIPLAQLAAVADLQQAVLRLAKNLEGRAGRRGRSPLPVEELTKLVAVGIQSGSAVLEIQAPALAGQLPFSDVGLDALSLLEDSLESLSRGEPLGDGVDGWSEQGIAAFLSGLSNYESIELEDRRNGFARRVEVSPAAASAALRRRWPTAEIVDALSGKLYELNIKTGTYRLEDDLGRTILLDFETTSENLDLLRPLIGRRVVAHGTTHPESGHPHRFEAATLELAEPVAQSEFFDFDLEGVIQQARRTGSMADLRIDDFDDEEAMLFWEAISE